MSVKHIFLQATLTVKGNTVKNSSLALCLIFVLLGCHENNSNNGDVLTKEQIITKAKEAAILYDDYPMEGTVILYDTHSTEWKKQFKQKALEQPNFSSINERMHKELEGKNYQAVCISNPDWLLAGSVWVYIDKSSGEVIQFLPNF